MDHFREVLHRGANRDWKDYLEKQNRPQRVHHMPSGYNQKSDVVVIRGGTSSPIEESNVNPDVYTDDNGVTWYRVPAEVVDMWYNPDIICRTSTVSRVYIKRPDGSVWEMGI